MRGAATVKDPDDGPVSLSDMHDIANICMLKSPIDRTADNNLALAWGEPSPFFNMDLRPHLNSEGREKASRNVGFPCSALARQHNYQDVLARYQRLAFGILLHAGQILQNFDRIPRYASGR